MNEKRLVIGSTNVYIFLGYGYEQIDLKIFVSYEI